MASSLSGEEKEIYPTLVANLQISEIDRHIFKYWEDNDVFTVSVSGRADQENFTFYDGPPFANGLPHYGHLLTGFIKDAVARFFTMDGKQVPRRFGWDCHGLPAEMGAEKELNVSGKAQIIEYGIDRFNDYCRQSVMRYSGAWKDYVTRQARWVDFDNAYKTMDVDYMESVLWAFKSLYDKGLVYEAQRVVPYSWKCQTILSNFETRLDNAYRKKISKTVIVKFKISEQLSGYEGHDVFMLVWTTTPWTLPSNLALAVSRDVQYKIVKHEDCYVIASSSFFDKEETGEVLSADSLIGLSYTPMFSYFEGNKNSFRILEADFIEDGSGTSIVHIAPGFGEEDFTLCASHNIPLVCPVDDMGCFTGEVNDFSGMQVFETNDPIIQQLKNNDRIWSVSTYEHNYPHCWRTDTPLIYKAVSSWYVKVTDLREKLTYHNKQINWYPEHVGSGLFHNWLAGAKDWAISRNRYWGTPIPIWRSTDPNNKKLYVYGSIEDIEKDFGVKCTDLHREFLDTLTRPDPENRDAVLQRVPDVFDCWFESGSMPYAQYHYPFENKDVFERRLPADFITEYVAQTRGWFYTMMVLSVALFDQAPFLNCICHGVVLDENGNKLSKRLNNYPDPLEMFDMYGSDAMRFLMLSSSIVKGGNLMLNDSMIKDVNRLVVKPLLNALHFFVMYANADGIVADKESLDEIELIDRYIITKLSIISNEILKEFRVYNVSAVCEHVMDFIDVLNNWYIRRNRKRFWDVNKTPSKRAAYNTLLYVLSSFSKMIAPVLPVLSEFIFLSLNNQQSVHLEMHVDKYEISTDDLNLVLKMDMVREICKAGLFIRNQKGLKVRQTLNQMTIFYDKNPLLEGLSGVIMEEVNVKSVHFVDSLFDKVTVSVKMNYKNIARKWPEKVQTLLKLVRNKEYVITDDNCLLIDDLSLTQEFFTVVVESNTEDSVVIDGKLLMVNLDTKLTEELIIEGQARDLVRFIQQARKEMGLEIKDRISVIIHRDANLQEEGLLRIWKEYILEQTLSEEMLFQDHISDVDYTATINKLIIGVNKL